MAKFFGTGHGVFVAMLIQMLFIVMWCQALQVTEAKSYYEYLGPYYQHDTIDGHTASDVVAFAGSDNYTKSGPKMGAVTIFDDPVTVSPDINSTMVGRAQGLQVVNSLDGRNSLISLTLILANGTMNFQGFFSAYTKTTGYGRLHFLGGTGEFQSVTRGYFDMTDYQNTILNVTAAYHKAKSLT